MEDKISNLKNKTPIAMLFLVSFICKVVACINDFTCYNYVPESERYYGYYELAFEFPDLSTLLLLLIDLAPIVLMLLYVMFFYKQRKAAILVPISFGLIVLIKLLYLGYDNLNFVANLVTIVAFVLLTIDALIGFNKDIYAIIACLCGMLIQIIPLLNFLESVETYINDETYLDLFTGPCSIVGMLVLYIAILMFPLNNRIPAIIKTRMSPKKLLNELQYELKEGIITQEEYQTRRNEIISKL